MIFSMAERTGFEPAIRVSVYTLSKRAPSTTRPPLHGTALFILHAFQACAYRSGVYTPSLHRLLITSRASSHVILVGSVSHSATSPH